MAQIKLNRVVCDDPQHDFLKDDVYFTLHNNGGTTGNVTTHTMTGMDKGQLRIFDGGHGQDPHSSKIFHMPHETFDFSKSLKMSLVEDGGPGTVFDHEIATQEIKAAAATNVDLPFQLEGVRYVLNYDVIV